MGKSRNSCNLLEKEEGLSQEIAEVLSKWSLRQERGSLQ